MNAWYRDYADYLSERFAGKVQKISVNADLICPNRDGTKGRGGCAYCNVASFAPDYTMHGSVAEQLAEGRRFFSRKYPQMRYLAYFQSYTNTHGDIDRVLALYREAIAQPDIVGLVIGTRPDCMPDSMLEVLADINRTHRVIIEYGAESSHDRTLERVNRCHTWADTVDAVMRTHAAGLDTGLHFIMGLPGETRPMMLTTIDRINELPVDTVKFHHLQLIRGTRLAAEQVPVFELDDYLHLCADIVARLRPDIAIERFVSSAPANLLIAPRWGLKNYQFTHLLHNLLASR